MWRIESSAVALLIMSASGPAHHAEAATSVCAMDQLAAPTPLLGASFGWSAAINSGRAIVGAYYDSAGGEATGAAYLFDRRLDGHWVYATRLTPPDAQFGDYLGASVALDGHRALVGATGRPVGESTGVAYLFRQEGLTWVLEARLDGPPRQEYQGFGQAVALQGDLAVVAAFRNDHGFLAGGIHVFQRDDITGQWSPQAQIGPEHLIDGDLPGRSIALSDDLLLIGALPLAPSPVEPARAYVFRRLADGSWTRLAVIRPDPAAEDDDFGVSVALNSPSKDGRLLIGAYQDDAAAHDSGAAYVFRRVADDQWVQEARLYPAAGDSHGYFGFSVALADDVAVIGASQSDAAAFDGGAAYVFRRTPGGAWTESDALVADDAAPLDAFGWSVATDGQSAIVGAIGHDVPELLCGRAWTFVVGGVDCDLSGTPDWCDLAAGLTIDADRDGVPDPCQEPATPGDLDRDGQVTGVDLAILLGQWTGPIEYNPCPPHTPADLNADCRIDGMDVALLLGAWS